MMFVLRYSLITNDAPDLLAFTAAIFARVRPRRSIPADRQYLLITSLNSGSRYFFNPRAHQSTAYNTDLICR